jgi:hypothetical protein
MRAHKKFEDQSKKNTHDNLSLENSTTPTCAVYTRYVALGMACRQSENSTFQTYTHLICVVWHRISHQTGLAQWVQFQHLHPYTTGIRLFVKCQVLCRVYFIGHSAKQALLSATLGEKRHSTQVTFTESQTLSINRRSTKESLLSIKHLVKRDPR